MSKGGFLFLLVVVCLGFYWVSTGQYDPNRPGGRPADAAGVDVDTAELVARIPVRAEIRLHDQPNVRDYVREDWPHWITRDNGCNTREATLIRDGWKVTHDPDTCQITGGTWRSSYDHKRHTTAGTVQIDHIVALAEAHASGGAYWPREHKQKFANDPLNVQAVTGRLNQSKGDDDPAEFLPEYGTCAYVARWVVLKDRYGLSWDAAEKRAVVRVLAKPTCQKDGG